ncbi:DUF3231 family protein [Oceanobacillus halophilus]|uniref:DUF3231 family protein n=1 Tax=Oceanobacillus halophilus TaxID=930130 RepID=A0A495AE54_9BACI|nr:DUF3231 family protein [Oceanobacillus halophilus]RKQ37983.1 DUF3231 family protein [Oceanobacillus halophilus]
MHNHEKPLTSAEISTLWANYLGDSMSICVFKYFLTHLEDAEIKKVVDYAIDLSQQHVKTIEDIFKQEGIAVPKAFGEEDVHTDAKRLFSDTFYLKYVKNMAKGGLANYASALPNLVRQDIRSYIGKSIDSTKELYNIATDLLLTKGFEIRPPSIPYPKEVSFVKDQHFLAGWMGEQRTLTGTEITQLYANIETNRLGLSLIIGFSQVAKDATIRKYMMRGKKMAKKHIDIFSSFLQKHDIPFSTSGQNEVTDSTEAPFSDKLIMYHVGLLSAAGMGNYGVAMALSPRRDIAMYLGRLLMEVGLFSEDGMNITIRNGWMEYPPSAIDRNNLARRP